jgi:thiol-disulfide isomerase/thioredoxin
MSFTRTAMYSLGALAVAGLAAFVIFSTLQPGTGVLPDFELALFDVQGGTISDETLKFSDLKGTRVVFNFWASWCEPCRDEVPLLEKTSKAYKDKNVQFIGVAFWSGWETVSSATIFMNSFGATYPTGPDLNREVYSAYLAPLDLVPLASPPSAAAITS